MQHYTTIEQSKKLVELGLNIDTADMSYPMLYNRAIDGGGKRINDRAELYKPIGEDMPCWSISALLGMMPKNIYTPVKEELGLHIFHIDGRWNFEYGYSNNSYSVLQQDEDLLNAAYNMIVWLLENKYIK